MPYNAEKLLAEASNCGLRITDLDGWTQTRLATALHVRRETLNAIINQSPAARPTVERPKMLDACQKLIAFAAALSSKEDSVLKLPINAANLQSDDGQLYEHHRLRLHQLVEQAGRDGQYADALCRVGEFASAAVHAAPAYRLRMLCNLATALQRLLDKPACRDVAPTMLRTNVGRLYRLERAARREGRRCRSDDAAVEKLGYVRGQVGYALVFSGMLLGENRLVRRGGTRLFAAAAAQPDPSYGHWSNLLRATNDLIGSSAGDGQPWAARALALAKSQRGSGFATAYASLESKGEIPRLRQHWADGMQADTVRRLTRPARSRAASRAAGAILLLLAGVVCTTATTTRAGDGRDFRTTDTITAGGGTPAARPQVTIAPPRPQQATPRTPAAAAAADRQASSTPTSPAPRVGRFVLPGDDDLGQGPSLPPVGSPSERAVLMDILTGAADPAAGPAAPESTWGPNVAACVNAARAAKIAPKPAAAATPPAATPAAPAAAVPPTELAARELQMARNYLAVHRDDLAKARLEKVRAAYPGTPAAREASVALAKLP